MDEKLRKAVLSGWTVDDAVPKEPIFTKDEIECILNNVKTECGYAFDFKLKENIRLKLEQMLNE